MTNAAAIGVWSAVRTPAHIAHGFDQLTRFPFHQAGGCPPLVILRERQATEGSPSSLADPSPLAQDDKPRGRAAIDRTSDAGAAVRATGRALHLLSRIPGGHWRTSCLYRSVAECAALRALGHDVRVVLAVGHDANGDEGGVAAHAWVVDSLGRVAGSAPAAPTFTRLRRA